ncbi:hypothetical protein [Erythrobacter phage vB_EliS-L02]|nr:hypothetical protein [Erythrobacter phage vB_EliS-L02]
MMQIHDDVIEHATELADRDEDKLAKIAGFTVWPDYDTWMEFKLEGVQFGIYFHGEEGRSVTRGIGLVIGQFPDEVDPHLIPFRIDLPAYKMEFIDIQQYARIKAEKLGVDDRTKRMFNLVQPRAELSIDPIAAAAQVQPFMNGMKKLLFTLLAFLNSPKLIRVDHNDMAKFNARRLKRGKYLYHPHHEVKLNIDKHVLKVQEGQGDGPERCLHFVRAHLRYLVHPRYKNVSVVLVPPHTRGNPELGITDASYAMERSGSKWKEDA